jgi:hypothetical protein
MHARPRTAAVMTALIFAAAAAVPPTAWAQVRPTVDIAPFAASGAPAPLFDASDTVRSAPRPLFDVEPLAVAAQTQASPVTTAPNDHMFGLGIRLGGARVGIGASARYFFGGGPLGFQGEVSRYGHAAGPVNWSSVQFSPAVIYRFRQHQFEGPLSLTPHAGGGLSIVHYSFDESDPLLDPFDVDDTSVGLLFFGGVELFFRNVPNLGVSGGLTINTNDDVGTAPVGGAAFTAAGHWYFW